MAAVMVMQPVVEGRERRRAGDDPRLVQLALIWRGGGSERRAAGKRAPGAGVAGWRQAAPVDPEEGAGAVGAGAGLGASDVGRFAGGVGVQGTHSGPRITRDACLGRRGTRGMAPVCARRRERTLG